MSIRASPASRSARGSVAVWIRLRGLELAGDARASLALHLHHAFERLLLPRRLGERQHEQHAEQQHEADGGRGRVEQRSLRAEGDERDRRGQHDADRHQQRRVARLPARRREDEPCRRAAETARPRATAPSPAGASSVPS